MNRFNKINKKIFFISMTSLILFIVLPFIVNIVGPGKNALINISMSKENFISSILIYINGIIQFTLFFYFSFSRSKIKITFSDILICLWLFGIVIFSLFTVYLSITFQPGLRGL